jgi:L-amino acid N-acyltransferase YncA
MVTFRTAQVSDASAILEIYAPFVQSTAVSFETVVPSENEMQGRIEKCLQKYPWLVCEIDGRVTGYAYGSLHREREAYQWTCESSIYLHTGQRQKGLGFLLYAALLQCLRQQGFVNVYGGITLPNEASIRLHEKCGFVHFATYDNIGFKFGEWHKVGWWKLQLNEYSLKPPPPVLFPQLDLHFIAATYRAATAAMQSSL